MLIHGFTVEFNLSWDNRRLRKKNDSTEGKLEDMQGSWKIPKEKVKCVVRDAGANMKKAVSLLDVPHIDCTSHRIENLIKEAQETRGLRCRRPLRVPLLTARHRTAGLQWARVNQDWLLPQWRNVLFSDESRFGLVSDDYRERVWRERGGQNRLATAIVNDGACLKDEIQEPPNRLNYKLSEEDEGRYTPDIPTEDKSVDEYGDSNSKYKKTNSDDDILDDGKSPKEEKHPKKYNDRDKPGSDDEDLMENKNSSRMSHGRHHRKNIDDRNKSDKDSESSSDPKNSERPYNRHKEDRNRSDDRKCPKEKKHPKKYNDRDKPG
nr:unnamed protein product [Callosobruchus chinensis]